MNLKTHPTKTVLERLLPEAHVSGGSFANSLPDPDTLTREERLSFYNDARRDAVTATVEDLLHSINAREGPPLERGSDGNRIWPDGYAGSITHKGTAVLGSVIQRGISQSIGIDLELNENNSEGLGHTVFDGEAPPGADKDTSIVAAFSIKEASYKAFYPLKQQRVDFDDIRLVWKEQLESVDIGVAKCPESVELRIQCTYRGNWIVSTAQF